MIDVYTFSMVSHGKLVNATVTRVDLYPCGTLQAYRRHLGRGEPTCQPCREAARQDVARDRAQGKPRGGNGF